MATIAAEESIAKLHKSNGGREQFLPVLNSYSLRQVSGNGRLVSGGGCILPCTSFWIQIDYPEKAKLGPPLSIINVCGGEDYVTLLPNGSSDLMM